MKYHVFVWAIDGISFSNAFVAEATETKKWLEELESNGEFEHLAYYDFPYSEPKPKWCITLDEVKQQYKDSLSL